MNAKRGVDVSGVKIDRVLAAEADYLDRHHEQYSDDEYERKMCRIKEAQKELSKPNRLLINFNWAYVYVKLDDPHDLVRSFDHEDGQDEFVFYIMTRDGRKLTVKNRGDRVASDDLSTVVSVHPSADHSIFVLQI